MLDVLKYSTWNLLWLRFVRSVFLFDDNGTIFFGPFA